MNPQTLLSSVSPPTLDSGRAGRVAFGLRSGGKPAKSTKPDADPDRVRRYNRPDGVGGSRRPNRRAEGGQTLAVAN